MTCTLGTGEKDTTIVGSASVSERGGGRKKGRSHSALHSGACPLAARWLPLAAAGCRWLSRISHLDLHGVDDGRDVVGETVGDGATIVLGPLDEEDAQPEDAAHDDDDDAEHGEGHAASGGAHDFVPHGVGVECGLAVLQWRTRRRRRRGRGTSSDR